MDKRAEKLFINYNKEADVPEDIIEKYHNRVSDEVIDMWKTYGFGSTENGYYKIVNPDDYEDIIKDIYECGFEPTVIFATSMADLIFCDNSDYFWYADIRHQKSDVVCEGFTTTLWIMNDVTFRQDELSWDLYEEAVKRYGIPAYKECFAYQPLLSLGGKENVDSMKKVNMQVHLDIVSQMQDIITL